MTESISPQYDNLDPSARLAAETPRQIANAATIWAVENVLIFLPFAGWFARAVHWMVPDRAESEKILVRPKYLDEELIAIPSLALVRMQLEVGHMAEWVQKMLNAYKPALESDDLERFNDIMRDSDRVTVLRDQIVDYARRLGQSSLTEEVSDKYANLLRVTMETASLAEVIARELIPAGQAFLEHKITPSDVTGEMLDQAYLMVCRNVASAFEAVVQDDQRVAQDILVYKDEFWQLSKEVMRRQAHKLSLDDPNRLLKHRLQTEVIDKLRRIYILAEHLAATVLPSSVVTGELEAQT